MSGSLASASSRQNDADSQGGIQSCSESISSDLDSMLTLMGVTMKRGSRALEQNAHTFKG